MASSTIDVRQEDKWRTRSGKNFLVRAIEWIDGLPITVWGIEYGDDYAVIEGDTKSYTCGYLRHWTLIEREGKEIKPKPTEWRYSIVLDSGGYYFVQNQFGKSWSTSSIHTHNYFLRFDWSNHPWPDKSFLYPARDVLFTMYKHSNGTLAYWWEKDCDVIHPCAVIMGEDLDGK